MTHQPVMPGQSLPRTVRTSAFLVLLGLVTGLAACGTNLDMDAVGKSVNDGIRSQLSLPVASVTCPAGTHAAKAGDTFECTVTPKDGGLITVKVVQQDDKGNVKWEVVKTEGLIDLKIVEDAVSKGRSTRFACRRAERPPGATRPG